MHIESNIDLKPFNTFGLSAKAGMLIHVTCEADIRQVLEHPEYGPASKLVLGGGSNIVPISDLPVTVLKIEILGRCLAQETDEHWIVDAGAGESWPDLVAWTLAEGWPGLENLALIPGTVGAAPVQNIGAYGVALKDRFDSLEAVDLITGQAFTLDTAACRFGYRDSIFKGRLAGRAVITRVRLRLPKRWQPILDYPDLKRKRLERGGAEIKARQVFDWVCELRRAKLPDPVVLGNAGSFFKNPVVNRNRRDAILKQAPGLVSFTVPNGDFKLSAGWLIEACGWKGKCMGQVGVYENQALVLVNRGGATGREVAALARAIQNSVYERFGVQLEIEPTVVE